MKVGRSRAGLQAGLGSALGKMVPALSASQNNETAPLTILRLLLQVGETSASYNQFSLALSSHQNITICTYFKSRISVPEEITLFEGNNSLQGFFGALKAALDHKHYDVIHVHSPHLGLLFIVASLFMSGRLLRSTVYTFHNSYSSYKLRNKLMLYPVFALFGRVVCCSYSSLGSLPRFLKWLAGQRICAVQNGVDLDRVDRALENSSRTHQERPFTVVSVGRLIEIKKPISVLNAYKQGSNGGSRLVFIGEGDLRPMLVEEIGKSRLDKQAKITGLLPRDELFAYLARADLFVSASRGEGLPVAVLEAMACRCPVILSDIPPHREIASGVDFIPLIQLNDVKGFAEQIRRFQSMAPPERSEIGRKCRQHVEERFSLTSMHRGYEKVYLQLLDESRN